MSRRILELSLLFSLLLALAPSVHAQHEASEASGQIVDRDGKPLEDVVVTFKAKSNPQLRYTGKSNKKGRYDIAGIYTPRADELWTVEVSRPGYLPVKVRVESRTVNKVLLGDILEQSLRPGSQIAQFPIARMGFAKVDLTLAPEGAVAAEAAVAARATQAAGEGASAAAAGQPSQRSDPWIEATTRANAGDFSGSLPLFVEAIDKAPEDLERRETYAKVLAHLERWDEAREAIAHALELAPQRLETRMLEASVCLAQGDLERARRALEAARDLAPNEPRVYQQLARVAAEADDTAGQIAAYESITRIDPGGAEAWLALGDLYADSGRKAASETAYRKVVDLDPKNAYRTYFNLAVLILQREEHDEQDLGRAIDSLRKAVAIKQDFAPAWRELGLALIGTGDQVGAVRALETYLRVKPDAADARQMRSVIDGLRTK